jgi:hypothetical protein
MSNVTDITPRLKNGEWTEKTYSAPVIELLADDLDAQVTVVQTGDHTFEHRRGHVLHREDGFAIEFGDGRGLYALNGDIVNPPDNGDLGLRLRYVVSGSQFWSSEVDGRSYEAVRHENGDMEFFRDGVAHRDGDPAVIWADGSEYWIVDGVRHPGATARSGTGSSDGQYTTSIGSKYDGYVDVADVAKKVRVDLKRAHAAGVLPAAATLSVTTDKFAGGQSIHVEVRGMFDSEIFEPTDDGHHHTAKTAKMLKRVEEICDAYGKSTSDWQSDYHHTVFYTSVTAESERSAAWRLNEVAKKKAVRLAKAELNRGK